MFIKSVISWKEVINLLFDYLPQSVLSFRRHWWWTVCLRTRLHQHGVKHSQQLPYSLFAITQAWGWVLPYLGAYGISYVAISSLVSKTKSDFQFSSVQFSRSVMSDSLQPHGLQHSRPSCPSPSPRVHPNPCPWSWWCHPTISSFVGPSLPAFILSQHQGLFQQVSSSHQVAKVLKFQLQYQSFQWIFRTDFL